MFSFIKSMKFRRAIDRALADHVITDAEITAIDRLQEELCLADGQAQAEYEKKVGSLTRKLTDRESGRASGRERVCPYGKLSGVAVSLKKKSKRTSNDDERQSLLYHRLNLC